MGCSAAQGAAKHRPTSNQMSFSQITRADSREIPCARLSVHVAGRGCAAPLEGLRLSSTARAQQQHSSQGAKHRTQPQHQPCCTAHFIPLLLPATPPRSITELFLHEQCTQKQSSPPAVSLCCPHAIDLANLQLTASLTPPCPISCLQSASYPYHSSKHPSQSHCLHSK